VDDDVSAKPAGRSASFIKYSTCLNLTDFTGSHSHRIKWIQCLEYRIERHR